MRDQVDLVSSEPPAPVAESSLQEGTTVTEERCSVIGESVFAVVFQCTLPGTEDCATAALHDYPRAVAQYLIEQSLESVDVDIELTQRRGSTCGVVVQLPRKQ